ncbi:MAG: tetratricopeptide repeat-containing protein [Bacteroidia bacterium]|nr:tetratricopeptide repeat-containing protein [Bacteroidia bacterium]
MNRAFFIQLLQQPRLSNKEQENDLREIVNAYPYFQSAQVLLAKNLHNQNSYLYEKQLKTAALYAGSRKLLYHFIQQPEHETPEFVTETVVETHPPATELIVANLPAEEPIQQPQESILEHTVIEDKLTPVAVPQKEITPEPAIELTAELTETTHPPEEITTIQENIAIETTRVDQPVIIHANEPHSFDEWLNLISGKYQIDTIDPSNADEELAADTRLIKEEKSIEDEIIKPAAETPVNKNKAFDTDSIIEKFIKESPSISRPKAEFFNPVNMAKISIEEDDDLATETLAKIYTKQGNYKKAIRIYEKLCLKFPDKMPYFVALIQKIKSDNKID